MKKTTALIMVTLSAIMWAASGTAAQHFFANSEKGAMELTNIRMTLAGFLLLPFAWQTGGLSRSLKVLRSKPRLFVDVAIYSIIGIFLVQLTYFKGISIGNAAATTVICYTCPAMVICYDTFHNHCLPKIGDALAVVMAVCGIFLLVTGGDPGKLSVPFACLCWSLASGACFAFATIYPRHLLIEIDQYFLLSVGMLIGGFVSFPLTRNLDWDPFFYTDVIFDLAYIIIIGTAAAFFFFNSGLIHLSPEEATVTATVEPAASVIFASLIFDTHFGNMEIIGILMVIFAILMPLIFDYVTKRWKKNFFSHLHRGA